MNNGEISELARRDVLRMSNEEANSLTKECLFEALLKLMKKKPFDKITVSELTRLAGVSRTAFYRNYKAVTEIITEPLMGMVTFLKASLKDEKYKDNIRAWYYDMFCLLREQAEMLSMLLAATDGDFIDMKYIGDVFDLSDDGSEQAKYRYVAFNGAMKAVLTEWVRGGCKADADFLADLCVTIQGICNE